MVTTREIAEATGKTPKQMKEILYYRGIKPVKVSETGRRKYFYDDSVVDEVKKIIAETEAKKVHSDSEKEQRRKEYDRKYREAHREQLASKQREYYRTHGRKRTENKAAVYYKVSVQNVYKKWEVKACSLSRTDAKMISDELSNVGITARFKPHSFGLRRTA